MTEDGAHSDVERIKRESRGLRGTIAETLADPGAVKLSDDDEQLIKFHGSYQGYNRDTATARKKQKLDKEWEFMVRAKIPAGRLTAAQYLALDEFADTHGNGTLRITSRQGLQFHNIIKGELKPLIADINRAMVTTLGGCGDVVRNVMADPSPVKSPAHAQILEDAKAVSDATMPATRAYHELWIDGEKLSSDPDPVDPLYKDVYLPRKFKIALALPEDNTVDVLVNDIGLVALVKDGQVEGYNMFLGGGFGMKHNTAETYPRLAEPIAYILRARVVEACKAVVRMQADWGDRSNRQHARLKYVVAEKGAAWVKDTLEGYYGEPLESVRPMPRLQIYDHMGWHAQGAGRFYLGIHILSGRIKDAEGVYLRTALRQIVGKYNPNLVLMPTEDLLLCDLEEGWRADIETILTSHGMHLAHELRPVEQWAMSCVALPTCGKALTEGERARVPIVGMVLEALKKHGLEREKLAVRITGCPNGCSRPYTGDIGIVGRAPGIYALFLGGSFEGDRLSFKVADKVKMEEIGTTLEPLFGVFAAERSPGEGFGDFCARIGTARVIDIIEEQS